MSKYKFHNFDYKFGASLKSILKQNDIASITDLGCGTGAYVKMIEENNIQVSHVIFMPAICTYRYVMS